MRRKRTLLFALIFALSPIFSSFSYELIEQELAPEEYSACDEISCYIDENGNLVQEDRTLQLKKQVEDDANQQHKYIEELKSIGSAEAVDQVYVGQTDNMLPSAPFGMAIDGKEIATGKLINPERVKDLKMLENNIETRFNSIVKDKILGVDIFRDNNFGKDVVVVPYANYPHFIEKAELLFYEVDAESSADPVETITIATLGEEIYIDEDFFSYHKTDQFDVVLKVYDAEERFDLTSKRRLLEYTEDERAYVAESKNYLSLSNIPLRGGTVTVSGHDINQDAFVKVQGHKVPIDPEGRFVADFVVPNGKNNIEMDYMSNPSAKPIRYSREITIKDYDFFFIGVGDFTIGENKISSPSGLDPEKFGDKDGFFDEGRLAFFLRGKIKGEYLLTARADTGRQEFKDMLKGLDDQNDDFTRRIDADRYYPIFSDKSKVDDNYASQGKLYVKIERDESYAMWGSYKTEIRSTDLNQVRRTLYGGKVKWVGEDRTKYGEPMRELILFGASPESFPVTDEFRGTGGSIYFLSYRDMLLGSDKVRVETRDRNSDLVLHTKYLKYGYDYDIDYDSGRILLNEPLEGAVDDDDVIRSEDNEWGDPVYLVVSYEAKTSLATMKDANVIGGVAQAWVNDNVKVGVTAVHEDMKGSIDNKLYGIDAMIRKTPKTYVKGSYTLTEGTNIERNTSLDGGFTTTTQSQFTTTKEKYGIDIEAAADLSELHEKVNGRFKGYYRELESGFIGVAQSTQTDTKQYGGTLHLTPNEYFRLRAEYDHKDNNGNKNDRYSGEVTATPYKYLDITTGITYQDKQNSDESTDIGLRVKYKFGENYKNNVYVFGQDVINKSGNSTRNFRRYGVGTSISFMEKFALGAEAAITDDENFRGKLKGTYDKNNKTSYYVGYQIDRDRIFDQNNSSANRMKGAMVLGGRTKYSDGLSFSAEEKYHHGKNNNGHTNNFGLRFTPYQDWKFGLTFEYGDVGTIERLSTTGSASYGKKERNMRTSIEYRSEKDSSKADNANRREVYAWRFSGTEQINEDFSVLGKFNVSYSEGNIAKVKRGDFIETSLGLAYRPISVVKKLNLLGKYNFYYDFPTSAQSAKSAANTRQRTHVLSVDGNYDVNEIVTLGFKYGYRHRQEKVIDLSADWLKSVAHLGLLRLDLHVTHQWDLFVEGRELYNNTAKASQLGALTGVYRHFGENVKLGGGYSWSEFDEDLTNMNYTKYGWFINLISKF